MPDHPLAIALLVVVVILAILAGLWFGRALGSGELAEKLSWSSLSKRLRAALTRAAVELWKRSRSSE
ncbi:MAG: hypothetical protein H6713_10865 [Myxococcales bacterium]|nr:hypothetical protein [Myxococcales bacterium]MCB9750478.1 hypothetical protein [Myxococcales bacterium]